ncbi:hypothetical protein J5J86_18215 [Aquabacter sp. L1I39]|uniref:hypothetical protein n=1 Tax=Aquabacter sp. L1I39 TaxID=2820278 RepID=UPI001ADCEE63|nr:hypothetical protein J5J86_18215 [Aquabacter sp. L1I39]
MRWSVIVERPLPQDDPKQRRPDIRLVRAQLDWVPTVPLREGLVRTIVYFETLLRAQGAEVQRYPGAFNAA